MVVIHTITYQTTRINNDLFNKSHKINVSYKSKPIYTITINLAIDNHTAQ